MFTMRDPRHDALVRSVHDPSSYQAVTQLAARLHALEAQFAVELGAVAQRQKQEYAELVHRLASRRRDYDRQQSGDGEEEMVGLEDH